MEFQWNDETVKEFIRTIFDRSPQNHLQPEIEKFKKSKELKKDYEILSYKSDWSGNIFLMKNMSKEILVDDNYKIHSVKRLSDGEIFTIGDKLTHGTIKGFSISKFGNLNTITEKGVLDIVELKKVKQPLFITEDGVDIFDGERVFMLSTDRWHTVEITIKSEQYNKMYEVEGSGEQFKYFSHKRAAEEYVLMNKPVHSVNDILNMFKHNENLSSYKNSLIRVSKSKI